MMTKIIFRLLIRNDECLKVVEELTVGVLAALLLPVHTIRDPDQLMTYPALPAGERFTLKFVQIRVSLFILCESLQNSFISL